MRGRRGRHETRTAPSPVRVREDAGRDVRADEGVDDERRGGQARDETTPLERRDIGDDDLGEDLESTRDTVR